MWKISSVQMAWFLAEGQDVTAASAYEAFTSRRPRQTQIEELSAPMPSTLETSQGEISPFQFRMQSQRGRLDLYVNQFPLAQASKALPPAIENMHALREIILEGAGRISRHIGDVQRLAYVVNAFTPCESDDDANEAVAFLANFSNDGVPVSELTVSFNKRKKSGLNPNRSLNRIMRWTPSVFQSFNFNVPMLSNYGNQIPLSFLPPEAVTVINVATLEVDVNTVPTGDVIESREQMVTFDELFFEVDALMADGTARRLLHDGS